MENLLNSLSRFIDLVVAATTSLFVFATVIAVIIGSVALILIIKENIEERKIKTKLIEKVKENEDENRIKR